MSEAHERFFLNDREVSREEFRAARFEQPRPTGAGDGLAAALEQAAKWFDDYERQHRAKMTAEAALKADVNADRAAWLRAALTTPNDTAIVGWRDIADAPRDGTFVLVVVPSGMVAIMQFCVAGYWRMRADDPLHYWTPTHWRPLPAPPASQAGEYKETDRG